jgi:hypothetical protein
MRPPEITVFLIIAIAKVHLMLRNIEYYLPLYLGCHTNKGKLVGIHEQIIITQSEDGNILKNDSSQKGTAIKPILKKLSNISGNESTELIRLGFNIGRPSGYSFSPNAFMFLLSLHVDLFGLIEAGLAIEMPGEK